jgi:hypothetical protein
MTMTTATLDHSSLRARQKQDVRCDPSRRSAFAMPQVRDISSWWIDRVYLHINWRRTALYRNSMDFPTHHVRAPKAPTG